MRKVTVLLLSLCFFNMSLFATASGKKGKTLLKECKQVVKKLKAEGWTVYGDAESLEIAFSRYYSMLEKSKNDEITIIGVGEAKSINLALQKAMNHAAVQYSSMKGSNVESSMITQEYSQLSDTGTRENETYMLSNSTSVSQNIKQFKPVLRINRHRSDGIIEVKVYYFIKS